MGDSSGPEGSAGQGLADYRGRDLRGVSFRGQDLDDADFREANLRGADFTGASLRGADFTGAQLGLRIHITLVILLAAAAVGASAGAASAIVAGEVRERAESSDWEVLASVAVSGFIAFAFLALLFWRGPRAAVFFFPIVLVLGIVAGILVNSAFATFDLGFALVTVGILLLFALAALAGILVRVLAWTFGLLLVVALTLAAGVAAGTLHGGIAALLLSIFMTVVARRSLGRNQPDRQIETIAHRVLTGRGTRFTGADLTGANFTHTDIVHTDMSGALTEHAVWEHLKGPPPLMPSTPRSQQPPPSSEEAATSSTDDTVPSDDRRTNGGQPPDRETNSSG